MAKLVVLIDIPDISEAELKETLNAWETPGKPGYVSVDEGVLQRDPEDDCFCSFKLLGVEGEQFGRRLTELSLAEILYDAPTIPDDVLAFVMLEYRMSQTGIKITDYDPFTGEIEVQWNFGASGKWMEASEAAKFAIDYMDEHVYLEGTRR